MNTPTEQYAFQSNGDLICLLLSEGTTYRLYSEKTQCFAQQIKFYNSLSPKDAEGFAQFCRNGNPNKPSVPNLQKARREDIPRMLLFPTTGYASVLAERYTYKLLETADLLSSAAAEILGPQVVLLLRERYPQHTLILTILFRESEQLYEQTSPILQHVPVLVKDMLRRLQKQPDADAGMEETPPYLRAFRQKHAAGQPPVFLDLPKFIPRLTMLLSRDLLFSHLHFQFQPPVENASYSVRFTAAAFLNTFVLLSYFMAILSQENTISISLVREEVRVCMRFFCKTDEIPEGFQTNGELYNLAESLPPFRGLLIFLQYLLQRDRIPFSCRHLTEEGIAGLECCLYFDTRYREEVEFQVYDPEQQIAEWLPLTLAFLRELVSETENDGEQIT